MFNILQTAERVSSVDLSDNFVLQRSKIAYTWTSHFVHGNVLEIGTGTGYGVGEIAHKVNNFITVDKYRPPSLNYEHCNNVYFLKMKIPPMTGLPSNHFDFVIIFQVIEHIQNDSRCINEIFRVLKDGGKLIISTPNNKMSLTRNPWHVREYTVESLEKLLASRFTEIDKMGVFGDNVAMEYYFENKASVEKLTRFDIFNLQYRLPRQLLQIPYDLLNRWNRKRLLKTHTELTTLITSDNYSIQPANDDSLDLLFVATKRAEAKEQKQAIAA